MTPAFFASSCFIDSNIWIYALTIETPAKTVIAQQTLQAHSTVFLSTQVINEVSVNLLRSHTFTQHEIRDLIDDFYQKYQVVALDQAILQLAATLRIQSRLSFWDSLIVASASACGTTLLYSEDMQDGHIIAGITIRNPFVEC